MPTISMFYGILVTILFEGNERHHLPHFHVRYQDFKAAIAICRIPSDHIPIRSWPLFLARELMRDLIETLKAEQST